MSHPLEEVPYSVYRLSDGEILRSGWCALRDRDAQASEGEAVLPGEYTDDRFCVVEGKPVKRPARTIQEARQALQDYLTR